MLLLRQSKRERPAFVVPAAAIVFAGLAVIIAAPGPAKAVPTPTGLVSDPASLVDPMIGTGSGGATVGQVDTFPGASAPFGMLTFSPDTPSRPDGGGYNYAADDHARDDVGRGERDHLAAVDGGGEHLDPG